MSIFTKYKQLHIDTLDADNNVVALALSKVLDVTETHLIIEMPTRFQSQMPVTFNEADFSSLLIKFESASKNANSFIAKTFDVVDHDGQKALRIERPKNRDVVKFNRRKGTRVHIPNLFLDIQNALTSRKERVEVIDACSKGFITIKASKSFLYTLRVNSTAAAGCQNGLINLDGSFLYGHMKTEERTPETSLIPVKSFKVVKQFDCDSNVSLLLELDYSTYEKTLLESFILEALTTQLLEDDIN